MKALFWSSFFLLAYAFAGYPALLALGTRIARRQGPAPGRASSAPTPSTTARPDVAPLAAHAADLPTVSILLSVYNEETVIAHKIANFHALEYPHDRMELCIVSDGSTDETDAIVQACGSPRVGLLRQERRGGKTLALNRAAQAATGDILVFTDANAMFRIDCVRMLVQRLADADIGLVSGISVYTDAHGAATAGGIYRRYEEWMKTRESDLFSIVGADGAAYALRRGLYAPLRPEYINDLIHPVQVVLQGRRAVSEPRAVVHEETDEGNGTAQMRRQTRIMAQSWLIFLRCLPDLVRAGQWGFVWQLASHKVLRWLALPLLAVLTVSALALAGEGAWYVLVLAGIAAGAVLAVLGARGQVGLPRTAWLFVVLHAAAVVGLFRLLRGETFVTWNPRGT
ncbi:glycosyltransferase family 2 protein [Nitratidesulfovibrio sp.]|uniref:glycosyltransferase family 2 protein n=1 Tax=Nitratidesulfovibrio sp. TaxID=2802297 RepID=UPI00334049B1